MSKTYSLVCSDARLKLWIGQGAETMQSLYTDGEHAGKLRRFLCATQGKSIVLMCDDTQGSDYLDFKEFEPGPCEKRLAPGQYWGFCGETDMGQTEPALCTECGGEYKLAE